MAIAERFPAATLVSATFGVELDCTPPQKKKDTRTSTPNVTTFGTSIFVSGIKLRQDDTRPGV